MPEKRSPLGWLIAVQPPTKAVPKLYAVMADNLERAKVLVGDNLKLTNEHVELHRILTDGEVGRLRLNPGEVKAYDG